MALSQKDLELISTIVNKNSTNTVSDDVMQAQIDAISKQVEINAGILSELKIISDNITKQTEKTEQINRTIYNGLSKDVEDLNKMWTLNEKQKLDNVYNDVCNKDGYLFRINTKILYLWIPLIPSIILSIILIFKLVNLSLGTQ